MGKEVDQPGKEEGSEQGLKLDLCFFFVTYMHTYIIIYKETEIRLAKNIYNTHTHANNDRTNYIYKRLCRGWTGLRSD